MVRTVRALLVAGVAILVASQAGAADVTIPGRISVVKTGKVFKFVAKPGPFALPVAGGGQDPQLHGAQLRVFDTGTSGGDVLYTLPAAGWRGLGSPTGSRGYKYRGSQANDPTCTIVFISDKVIKGVCKGAGVTLTPPFTGDEAILLGISAGTAGVGVPAGTSAVRYCAQFGGTTSRNDTRGLKRKRANAPGACASVPPPPTPTATATVFGTATITPTVTITRTSTLTPTATPILPTATPTRRNRWSSTSATSPAAAISRSTRRRSRCGQHERLAAHRARRPRRRGSGIAPTTCEIDHIDPINIPSIGYVCVQPAPGCDLGEADCNGGTPLGVDLRANGNVGSCASPTTGNADCADTCATFCAGTGRTTAPPAARAAARTASASARTTRPAGRQRGLVRRPRPGRRLAEGHLPVPVHQPARRRGRRLGRVPVPARRHHQRREQRAVRRRRHQGRHRPDIIPLTTATATTQINNANFSANSVPSSPASNTGARLTCSTIAGDDTTGLQGARRRRTSSARPWATSPSSCLRTVSEGTETGAQKSPPGGEGLRSPA